MNDRFFDSGPPEWIDRLPEQFHVRYVGLEVWRWLGLALLLLVAWVAVVLGRWLAIRLMRARERRRPGEITARRIGRCGAPQGCFAALSSAIPSWVR